MNLDYTYQKISILLADSESIDNSRINSIAYDTRKLLNGNGVLFFALEGVFRNGHDFIKDAYDKGVRHFVVSQAGITNELSGCNEIIVEDTLEALVAFAKYHRNRFECDVIGITGSNGKTTVKEWLTHLLTKKYNVIRSPKSYNSKLGVALSLLEITLTTEIAIIEVGISGPGKMAEIEALIKPTKGILTSIGLAHRELFDSDQAHLNEKLLLFGHLHQFIVPENVLEVAPKNAIEITQNKFDSYLRHLSFDDDINRQNASLAIAMAIDFGVDETSLKEAISGLNALALRLETYDGINGNTIINDTYNLDLDSLKHSLEYQLANSKGKKRVIIIGLGAKNEEKEIEIRSVVEEFKPAELHFHYAEDSTNYTFQNASVLIKGTRLAKMETLAREFKYQNHQTYLEIDFKAIRHNINYFKSLIKDSTKVLCMVKAASYGSDAKKMGQFLEKMGVDYLGVAYPDEGIELRENGISIPILVMNCEEKAFSQCIDYNLEPALFSLNQIDAFIKELIIRSIYNYPVHLKLETGMNRLGYSKKDLADVIDLIKGQPEITIKSIYSHLAESNLLKSEFTDHQIREFENLSTLIQNEFAYPILKHLLNSEGIVNYPSAQFDMVRLGIGMYGVTKSNNLRASISWISSISQLKSVKQAESIGYSRGFIAAQNMTIAVIPVGYADGFRRSLGNGKGGVFIGDSFCPTVGNVCMDMIMVDVTSLDVSEGQSVEIIGKHQTVINLAEKMDTIPYEVLTSFSKRVHRMYIDQ